MTVGPLLRLLPRGIFVAVAIFAATRPARAQTVITWGNGNASWNVGTNWNGGSAPGNSDTAQVAGGAATVDTNTTIAKLNLSAGNIGGAATLTITGSGSTWTGGSMNGTGAVTFGAGSSLAISGGNDHDLQSRPIQNQGTVNWTAGWLRGGQGTTFTNASGATFNATVDGYSMYNPWGGSYVFTNSGTFNRSGTGTTYIETTFDNPGTINVTGGRLMLRGGGTASGSFNVSGAGSDLVIDHSYALANGATLSGAVRFTAGTLTASGTITANGFSFEGGGLAGSQTLAGGTVSWTGGNWNGVAGDTTTLASTLTLNVGSGNDHDLYARALTNNGIVNWSAGYIRGGQGTVLTNAAGATFNDLNASNYSIHNPWGGSFVFQNSGTYVRNAANTTYFDLPFNNDGLVDVKQGNLEFRAGGTLGAAGSMAAAAGTNVYFRANYTITDGSSLTGAGNYWLTGGTLVVPGTLNVTTFNQSGGTLGGTNTIKGTYNWSGGNWSSSAGSTDTTTIGAGATLNLTTGSDKDWYGRGVTNAGTVNWNSGYIRGGQGSSFVNAAGATFNDLNASNYTIHNPWGGAFVFTNNGTYLRNAANTTYLDVPFDNNGTVTVQAGDLQFRAGGTTSSSGTINAASGTNVTFTASYTIADGSSLLGQGNYWLSGGTLNVPGNLTVSTFNQTGGTLGGTNTIKGTFNWSGGDWSAPANSGLSTTIDTGSTLNLNTGSNKDLYGRQVVNKGTVVWNLGYIRGGQGSSFVNATGATFDDRNSSNYTMHNPWGGAFSFTNNGTYLRNVTGTTYLDVPFDNNGTISLLQGTLQFRSGGTMAAGSSVNAAAGTEVYFTNNYTIADGSSLAGAGNYWLTGGALNVTGTLSVSTMNQTAGTLAGTNTLQGTYNWSGGDWSAAAGSGATTAVGVGATLNLNTGSNKDIYARGVTNRGTVNWNSGYLRGGQGSSFVNATGATFNDLNASGYTVHNPWGGAFTFTNNGNYVRNAANTTYFDVPFDNNGNITVQQGSLQLRAGGTMSATSVANVLADASLYFTGNYVIADGAQFTGAGLFQQTGGTLSIDGLLKAPTFIWSGGNWNAANDSGLITRIASTTTLVLSDASNNVRDFNGRAIVNEGTVNWNSGYIRGGNGSTFTNAAGANFNDFNASSYTLNNPYGGSFRFINNGTYTRNATGVSYFDTPFDNNGTINVQRGDIQFRGGGTLGSTGAINASSGTNVVFTNNYAVANAASLLGAGTYWLANGTLTATGTMTVSTFTQTGGTLDGTNTINGTYNWNGGNWNTGAPATGNPLAKTTIGTGGVLNLTDSNNNVRDFNYRDIVNTGIVNWSAGYIRGGNGSTFTNATGGTFNDLNSPGYTVNNPYGGAFTFVNNGNYTRNAGGTTYFDSPFNNAGTLTLAAGDIQLRAGGTMTATSVVNGAAGTHLYFTNNYTLLDGAQFAGDGTFQQTGGTLTIDGSLKAKTFVWSGGNWNAANNSGLTTTVAPTTILNLTDASNNVRDFNGRGIVNQGTVNWYSGYIRSGNGGTFTNAAGGVFNDFNSPSYTINNPFGGSFTFINDGVYNRNATNTTGFDSPFNNNGTVNLLAGDIQLRAGGTMTANSVFNGAEGTHLYFTNNYTLLDGARFAGLGTFQQTNGTLIADGSLRAPAFVWSGGNWNAANNSGLVTTIASTTTLLLTDASNNGRDFNGRGILNQGVVTWNSAYIRSGNGGTFVNAAGATFNDLNASSYSINNPFGGSFVFRNEGTYVRNAGGTTYFDTTFENSGTLNLLAGDIQIRGGGTMLASSVINASGGTHLYLTNDYTLANGAQFAGAGVFQQTGGTLTANGAIRASNFTWSGGSWNAANNSGLTTTIASGTTLTMTDSNGNVRDFNGRSITNQGTLVWQSAYLRGGNGSVLTNAAGGIFNDQNSAGYTIHNPFGGSFSVVNNGTYLKTGAATTTISVPFTNTGNVSVSGGTLVLGSTFTNSGALQFANGAALQTSNAVTMSTAALSGTGTVNAPSVTAGGVVAPGTPTGTLGITGNLTLLSTSTLLIELGGTAQGTGYDFVSIGGGTTLGGNLGVGFVNGFSASITPAATFTVLTTNGTGGLTGAFANVANGQRVSTFDGAGSFLVNYGTGSTFAANSVVLSSFVPVPEPSTWTMLGVGGALLLLRRRRKA